MPLLYGCCMGIVADHEGLWDAGRLGRAGVFAVALMLASAGTVILVHRMSASMAARRWSYVGLGLMVATVAAGLLPRETDGGYNICGPVLNLGRTDSEHCAAVMRPLPTIVALALVASVLAFTLAIVLGWRRQDSQ